MAELAKMVGEHPEKIYLHAEVQSLLRAGDRSVHSLFVQRFDSGGKPATAKPCKICRKALEIYGVKELSYTSSCGEIIQEKINYLER